MSGRPHSGRAPGCDTGIARSRARILAVLGPGIGAPPLVAVRHAGADLYEALWHHCDGGEFRAWQLRRSSDRRWWRTDGREWDVLRICRTYARGYHVAKLLAGAVLGAASTRDDTARYMRERACAICGEQDVAYCWRTPIGELLGEEWCGRCVPADVAAGKGGRLVAALQPGGHTTLLSTEQARSRLGNLGQWNFQSVSDYGACPLCGLGEHGSEHLLSWCPAVAVAWETLGGPAHVSLREACAVRDLADKAAPLLHQVAYLATILHGACCMDWREGARRLVRTVQA